MPPDFSASVITWHRHHGRRDLPWQQCRDPYPVWVSEIMLQQTQVTTVIPYFQRFTERFPTVGALAKSDIDEVLHLWTGLGYYARGRNLHQAAQIIQQEYRGQFPKTVEQVMSLPGIGRSTANAILAFTVGQRLPILDGNVKRVLTRYSGIYGWPGKREINAQLWALAEELTPETDVEIYTQAIMDLGATLCKRNRPLCQQCPVVRDCHAYRHNEQEELPTRAPKKHKPVKSVVMVIIQHKRAILLEQRPPTGIWGGLWSLPEVQPEAAIPPEIHSRYGLRVKPETPWKELRHSFTHFYLDIKPVPAALLNKDARVMENPRLVWYNPDTPNARGLAAPVKKLLEKLR